MIKYQKDTTNTVIVTLTERVTISNPFFLLKLIFKDNDSVSDIWLTDISDYPLRYNEFKMSTSLDLGQYIYNFYQKPNMDNTNLDDAVFLETGELTVWTIEAENKTYF